MSLIFDKTVGVLGAGVGGVATALELAHRGFSVHLFDKNKDILMGSSNATPGRAGHGFHYIHPKTGILYLDITLEVVKEFPGCLLAAGEDEDHYLKHGLYFIMKKSEDLENEDKQFASLFPVEEVLNTYEELRSAYRKKVEQNHELRFFGDPDKFFCLRDLREFSGIVDISKIAAVVDTREELLNWPLLRKNLGEKINFHPNIIVHTQTLIEKVDYDVATHGFSIKTSQGNFKVRYVVNATWENVERLSYQMGFCQPPNRTLRLKCIVKIVLPHLLRKESSMFFCMGAHCMFSNMGDGTGMITYAPVTNISSTMGLSLDDRAQRFLNGEASWDEKHNIGRKIIEGVAQYIPSIKDAEINEVGFGVIKTKGEVDIFDPISEFHHRDYLGVEVRQISWVDNSCMKLLYFLRNAHLTASTLEKHVIANAYIIEIKDRLLKSLNIFSKDVAQMIIVNLQRNYDPETIQRDQKVIGDSMQMVFVNKNHLNRQIVRKKEVTRCFVFSSLLRLWNEALLPNKVFFTVGLVVFSYQCANYYRGYNVGFFRPVFEIFKKLENQEPGRHNYRII